MTEIHARDTTTPSGIHRSLASIATILMMAAMLVWTAPVASADDPADDGTRLTWGIAPADAADADGRGSIEHLLEPGKSVIEHVVVRNLGADEVTLDLYAADATAADGVFDLLAADEESVGVGSWTSPAVGHVVLGPRERQLVPLEITVPVSAEPGDHAGGIVAVLHRPPDADQPLSVEHRVGTRIHVRVAGAVHPRLGVEITAADYHHTWMPLTSGTGQVLLTVRNDGNLRLAGGASVRLESVAGLGDDESEPIPVPELLPGESVDLAIAFDRIRPLGAITVGAVITPLTSGAQDLGGSVPPGSAQTTLWAVPWSTLALLALVAGALGYVLHRRRRARVQSVTSTTP